MKNFAANRLYLSATEYITGPVVVHLTEDGRVDSYEVLIQEHPFISWLGGVLLLLPADVESDRPVSGEIINYAQINPLYQPGRFSYALWHFSEASVDTPIAEIKTKAIRRLG